LERLWELGLPATGGRTLRCAAVVKAAGVRGAQLEVSPDEPPGRHAVITGWPWHESDLELQKAKQKERALLLSSAAGAPVLRQP
jgi:hypothetical protein